MDYLKIQIRPHFYMNCLNFIYSMIDFGQYDHAKSMSRITSDYLAYIFRNTSEMVPVTAETNHCENYLKILLLRYPEYCAKRPLQCEQGRALLRRRRYA